MSEAPTAEPWLEVLCSRDFASWLSFQSAGLAVTTYQTGKLFLLGVKPDGQVSIFERTFDRCMGLGVDPGGERFWLSTRYQMWDFANLLTPGNEFEGYDRLFVPKVGYTTGDIDIHDVAIEDTGRVVFCATKFNCLATLHERDSFTPLWRPKFNSKLVAEDRCHLNGLTLEDGKAAYVSAVSRSDVADGWRDRRRDGGVVIDVRSGEVAASGLSMPHSPRMYRGQLWLLNSGTGHFGRVDVKTGAFEPITFCPGYLRGLAFVGDYAVVGLSKPRHEKTFTGLALDDELKARDAVAQCGLQVIDLRTGEVAHWARFEGMVTELYDVGILPGAKRPRVVGFKSDEISRLISPGSESEL